MASYKARRRIYTRFLLCKSGILIGVANCLAINHLAKILRVAWLVVNSAQTKLSVCLEGDFCQTRWHYQSCLVVRQLLKTAAGSRNKSPSMPQRPLSAAGIKSPDENRRLTKVRCKSAQPINREHQPIPTEQKKGMTHDQLLTVVIRYLHWPW